MALEKSKFELIMAILDSGYADTAMEAAREVGARGGTIVHCRGTSPQEVEKKYGIAITPEKELLMILTSSQQKDTIIEAVYNAGIREKKKGIVFSLPVSSTAGLKYE